MSARKLLAIGLLFLLTYSQVGAFSFFGGNSVTSIDKASYAKNIFTVSIRSTPGFDGEKTFLVKSGVGGEIIGKPEIVDGAEWLQIQYTPEISGWIRAKLVARENYYVMSSDTKTIFLRERISLAGTTQDICSTSTPISATNVITSFRPQTPVFTYTPTDTTSTGTIDTVSSTTNVITSFRPQTPIFKYIVDEAISTTIDNSLVQTIASMIITSFRPQTPVFSYTPTNTTDTGTIDTVSSTTNVITSFRPQTPVFSYTPTNTTDTGTVDTASSTTNVITSFRPQTPVFTYTPVTYTCSSVQ